eukprot:superscaffoldBa00002674_g14966
MGQLRLNCPSKASSFSSFIPKVIETFSQRKNRHAAFLFNVNTKVAHLVVCHVGQTVVWLFFLSLGLDLLSVLVFHATVVVVVMV